MLNKLSSLRSSPRIHLAVVVALFLYLIFVRTRGISETFGLLGDQILYWRMALGPWEELPAGGGPTSVGGTTLGPVFCWMIWLICRAIGPFTDYLPHAGGIGIAILQSAADVVLLLAIWRRFSSFGLAFAVTLLAATSPFDMSLSTTIWNPPVAEALVKVSIACVLWEARRSWCEVPAIIAAWLAVQNHWSALFFAVPVIASFAARELLERRPRQALVRAVTAASILLVLQLPYVIEKMRHPSASTKPGAIVESMSYTLDHPSTLRPSAAFHATATALERILARPGNVLLPGTILALSVMFAGFKFRRDPPLAAVTAAPLVFAVAGLSFWQRPYDTYWFLTLAPSAALSVVLVLTASRPLARPALALLVTWVLLTQPARSAEAMTLHRLPEYGALVRGSREIVRRVGDVRSIKTTFALPETTEADFLYQVLGGRLSPAATYTATIDRAGRARFAQVNPQLEFQK